MTFLNIQQYGGLDGLNLSFVLYFPQSLFEVLGDRSKFSMIGITVTSIFHRFF